MSPPGDTPAVVTRAQASRADLQDARIDDLSNQMSDISKSLLSMQELLAKLPFSVEKMVHNAAGKKPVDVDPKPPPVPPPIPKTTLPPPVPPPFTPP